MKRTVSAFWKFYKLGLARSISHPLAPTVSLLLGLSDPEHQATEGLHTLNDLVLRRFFAISQRSLMCSAGTTSSCTPLSIRIGVVTGIFGSLLADSHFW